MNIEAQKDLKTSILMQIVEPLLLWYAQNARILPFREHPNPYHIWVSEIMLQQTRMEAVLPYFERFITALPTISALAAADEQAVLKLWEGLGYYSRVRNLKKAAEQIMSDHQGELPKSAELLEKLPGIGPYTAGAIASIAFGQVAPAIDGNVLRVVTRIQNDHSDIQNTAFKKLIYQQLLQVMPKTQTSAFTQALMELGALVCVPNGAPHCASCPLALLCEGARLGTAHTLPKKTPKKARKKEQKTMFLLFSTEATSNKCIALQKRPGKGLLANLWQLPHVDHFCTGEAAEDWLKHLGLAPQTITLLGETHHIFSHIEWQMQYYAVEMQTAPSATDFVWVTRKQLLEEYPLPAAFKGYYTTMLEKLV